MRSKPAGNAAPLAFGDLTLNSLLVSCNSSSFSFTAPCLPFFVCEKQEEHEIWSVSHLNSNLNLATYVCAALGELGR